MSKTTLTFEIRATETLTTTALPESTADKSVQFSSSDTAIAIVTPVQGKAIGVAAGAATITGTTINGKTATYEVTVTEAGGGA